MTENYQSEVYDDFLLKLIQDGKSIDSFLNVIFDFLRRKTDFYYILSKDQRKLGFPKDRALQMVTEAFRKHEKLFNSSLKLADSSPPPNSAAPPPQQTPVSNQNSGKSISRKKLSAPTSSGNCPETYQADAECYNGAVHDDFCWSQSIKEVDVRVPMPKHITRAKQIEVRLEKSNFWVEFDREDNDCDDVTVNDVKTCSTSSVTSSSTIQPAQSAHCKQRGRRRIGGRLVWPINVEQSMWTFESGVLTANLEKAQERWWESVFEHQQQLEKEEQQQEGEPEKVGQRKQKNTRGSGGGGEGNGRVDTRKIDCSRPIEELDEEAQVKIEQLMYDQHCKRLGLPTREQQKMNEALRQAWNAEGSPFAGTPFEPERLQMTGDSLQQFVNGGEASEATTPQSQPQQPQSSSSSEKTG